MFPHSKPKDGVVSIQPAARLSKSWWRPTSFQLDNDAFPAKLFSPSSQLASEPDRLDSDQRQGVRQDGSQPALADERWTFSEPDMNFTLVPTSWPLDSAHNGGDGAGKESAHYRVQPRSSGWQIVHQFI